MTSVLSTYPTTSAHNRAQGQRAAWPLSPLRARRPATSCPCSGRASSPSGRSGPGSTVSATRASAALKARTSAARRRSAVLLASAADSSHLNVRFVMPGRFSGHRSITRCGKNSSRACRRADPWEDVDFTSSELTIGWQIQRIDRQLLHRQTKTEASDAPLPLVPREGWLSRATSTGASPPLARALMSRRSRFTPPARRAPRSGRARRSPACGHAGARAQSDLSDHEHLQRGLIGCRPPRAQAAWQAARHREVAVPCCCTTAKRAGCKITTGP